MNMKKVIIAIHGLGNKPGRKILKKWWKAAVREGLANIDKPSKLPKFELIYWSDILYPESLDETENDKNKPLYFREKYEKSLNKKYPEAGKTRRKFLTLAEEAINSIFLNSDYSLNFESLTDNLLKKYFSDLHIYYNIKGSYIDGRTVSPRDLIRTRAASIINKYNGYEIFFIAHSMGSIIAFDVLKYLVPDTKVSVFATMGSPLGLPIIQGKIAAENRIYDNKEIIMSSPPGITDHWYNFSDPLDKIAFDFRLSDDFLPNIYNVKPEDFIVSNNYEIDNIRNPHKSYGYLRAPEFSELLYRFIKKDKNRFLIFIKKMFRKTEIKTGGIDESG